MSSLFAEGVSSLQIFTRYDLYHGLDSQNNLRNYLSHEHYLGIKIIINNLQTISVSQFNKILNPSRFSF